MIPSYINSKIKYKSFGVQAFKSLSVFSFILYLCFTGKSAQAHGDFVQVIAKSKAAVVMITTVRKSSKWSSKKQTKSTEVLGEYADYFSDKNDYPEKSSGSGYFINTSGQTRRLILTAYHVVDMASKISVKLNSGKVRTAKLLHFDKKSDVAILELITVEKTQQDKVALKLAMESAVEGQPLLAMGGAFGLPVSSTQGIVSAIGVKPTWRVVKGGLIQTDAVINPGSSGGPLLNMDGEVIGLVTQIYSNTGLFSGAAFAVPAEKVKVLLKKWGVSSRSSRNPGVSQP